MNVMADQKKSFISLQYYKVDALIVLTNQDRTQINEISEGHALRIFITTTKLMVINTDKKQ